MQYQPWFRQLIIGFPAGFLHTFGEEDTGRDSERQKGRETDRQRQTDRDRQADTDKQTEADRHIKRDIIIKRDGQIIRQRKRGLADRIKLVTS